MPDRDRPRPLGEVLQEMIDALGLQDKMDEARVIETWAAVAGRQVKFESDLVDEIVFR